MGTDRTSFARGLELLAQRQRAIQSPIRSPREARHEAKKIVKEAGVKGSSNEHYFQLLITCSLMGTEKMYYNFPLKRRKK